MYAITKYCIILESGINKRSLYLTYDMDGLSKDEIPKGTLVRKVSGFYPRNPIYDLKLLYSNRNLNVSTCRVLLEYLLACSDCMADGKVEA